MKRPAISMSHPSLSWSPERGERSHSGERAPVNKQGEAVQRYREHGNHDSHSVYKAIGSATFVSTDVLCSGQMVTEKTTTGFRAVCGGNFASATIDWVVVR